MNLENKNIVITGASRGLGRALALQLALKKTRLVLIARPSQDLESLKRELGKLNDQILIIEADISSKDHVYPIAGNTQRFLGSVDILIHNASTLGPVPLRPLFDTECEDFERALQTNLLGPFRLTKALLGPVAVDGQSLVIGISTDAAVNAYPDWGAYSASKIALDHLFKIWTQEAPQVKFISVDPGEMDTLMHAQAIPDADKTLLHSPIKQAQKLIQLIESIESKKSGERISL